MEVEAIPYPLDDAMPGKPLGSVAIAVTAQAMGEYLASLGLPPRDDGICPFMLLGTQPWGWKGAYAPYWRGGVAQDMSWTAQAPVTIGQVLRATAFIAERYVVRSRECSATAVTIVDADGRQAFSGHGTYSAKVDPARVRSDVERRDAAKDEDSVDKLPEGKRQSRTVILNREMSCLFWSHRSDIGQGNFHTSLKVAHAMGFPDLLIGSSQTASLASEAIQSLVGDAWLTGGALTVRFLKPVFAGDELTIDVTELSDAGRRRVYRGAIRNQRGDAVLAINGGIAAPA